MTISSNSATMMDEMLGRVTDDSPTEDDVVFGRGGYTNKHAANKRYLELVAQHEVAYFQEKRKYRKLVSLCLIHFLRVEGARFMEKAGSGKWKTVRLSRCREKISQRLRERIPFIKLELSKAPARLAALAVPETICFNKPVVTTPTEDSSVIVVTDPSSDEDNDNGLETDEVSVFSHPFKETEDDTISLASSGSLMGNSFDDLFEPIRMDGTEELQPSMKRLASLFDDDSSLELSPPKRQKRDDDDYSYGSVVDCFHDEDGLLMSNFGDFFSAVTTAGDDNSLFGNKISSLGNEAAFLDYFLL